MTKRAYWIVTVASIIILSGCIHQGPHRDSLPLSKKETPDDVINAVIRVGKTLTGQDMSQEDVRRLGQSVAKDPEAQSAITSITQTGVDAKYCPVDGKHFSGRVTLCPEHHVELRPISED